MKWKCPRWESAYRVPENDRERAFLLGEQAARGWMFLLPQLQFTISVVSWPAIKDACARVKTFDERGRLSPAAIGVLSSTGALRRVA